MSPPDNDILAERESDKTSPQDDSAAHGLSALIIGGVMFLAAPLTLVLATLVWRFADQSPNVVLLHAWLARVGAVSAVLMAAAGVVFGICGLRSNEEHRTASPLAKAGTLLSLGALGMWILTAVALLNTTESLLRLYGPDR